MLHSICIFEIIVVILQLTTLRHSSIIIHGFQRNHRVTWSFKSNLIDSTELFGPSENSFNMLSHGAMGQSKRSIIVCWSIYFDNVADFLQQRWTIPHPCITLPKITVSMSFVLVLKQLCVTIKNTDVAYGIGAIKRNVKNVAVFFPDITSKTLKLRQVPVWTFC